MKALTELNSRLVTLRDGRQGLRGGLHCEIKQVDGIGTLPILDFVATDETLDRYNEVIKLDGWDTKSYMANPVVPDCHSYDSIARILGRTILLTIEGGKMVNRVEFALDNPLGSMAFKMAKGGFIKSESVGFIPREWTNGNKPGEPDRTYTEQELLEISLVVVPANPGATVGLALKSGAIEREDIRRVIDALQIFCREKQIPAAPDGALGLGIPGAQSLQIARTLTSVLKK